MNKNLDILLSELSNDMDIEGYEVSSEDVQAVKRKLQASRAIEKITELVASKDAHQVLAALKKDIVED